MAKSSRSSARKNNAHRRAVNINAPVEQARAERLSAKLIELANQPKPESSDVNMDGNFFRHANPDLQFLEHDANTLSALNELVEDPDSKKTEEVDQTSKSSTALPCAPCLLTRTSGMEVDAKASKPRKSLHRVGKRKAKKGSIVFKKYGDKRGAKKSSKISK